MKCAKCKNEAVDGITLCQPCREKVRLRDKAYYKRNAEKIAIYQANYRKEHPVDLIEYHRGYRKRKKDQISQRKRERHLKDPEVSRNRNFNYHSAKRGTFISPIKRKELFERDGYICQLCGTGVLPFAHRLDPLYPTLDHIIPLSKGGTHEPSNLQTAHLGCNASKQDRPNKNPHYAAS